MSPGLLKLHGTLVLYELSQSDDTLMTLRSECSRGHNPGFAHYYQACPKKKRPDALRKMVTNGFMMLFSHVKISLDFKWSLSTPFTWTSRLQSSRIFARRIGEFEATLFRYMEDTHLDHFHAPVLPVYVSPCHCPKHEIKWIWHLQMRNKMQLLSAINNLSVWNGPTSKRWRQWNIKLKDSYERQGIFQ